ncbi:Foldase protein PrsA 1 [Bienertia sinuspersici]
MGFARLVGEYNAYARKVFGGGVCTKMRSSSSWQPPAEGQLKVNTDASVVAGQHTALGVVVRDCEGRVWEVEYAEAAATCYGVRVVVRLGFKQIVLECDSSSVAINVRNQARGYAPSFLFYDEILSAKECFDSFSCYHVKGGGNAVAHYVARWDINVSEEIMYTDNFSQSIVSLAGLDMK